MLQSLDDPTRGVHERGATRRAKGRESRISGFLILGALVLLPLGKYAGTEVFGFLSLAKIFALLAVFRMASTRTLFPPWRLLPDYVVVAYVALAISAVAWVPWIPFLEGGSVLTVQTRVALALLAGGVAASWISLDKQHWRFAAYVYAALLVVTSYIFPREVFIVGGIYGGVGRFEGWLGNSNEFGMACVLGLGILLLTFDRQSPTWQRLMSSALMFAMVAAAVQSLSRGSLAAMFVLGVAIVSLRFPAMLRLPIFMAMAVSIFVVLPVAISALPDTPLFNTWSDRIAGELNKGAFGMEEDNAIETRQQMLVDAFKAWKVEPIAGYGPESFAEVAGSGKSAHNTLAGEAVEFGLLGILGVVLAGAAFFGALMTVQRQRHVVIGCGIGLAALASGMASNAMYTQQYWIALGLAIGALSEDSLRARRQVARSAP